MNYYAFHIGDYAAHTRHLSPMADLCYRRMLDLYYQTEKPLPLDADEVARKIGLREHAQTVAEVLSDFFVRSEDGFRNKRCDEEILAYQAKSERGKHANRIRWGSNPDPKWIQNGSNPDPKRNTDKIPTNNQEPITNIPPTNADALVCPPVGGTKAKQGEERAKRAKALPEGWQPNEGHQRIAQELGVSLETELPQFRDHHTAKRSLMADWDAAFRTWLRNAAKWAKPAAKSKRNVPDYLPAEQWDTTGVDEWGLPIYPQKNGAPLSSIECDTKVSAAPRHGSPLGDFKLNGNHK